MAIVQSPIRAREKYYSDLDLAFDKNPNTGDLVRKFDLNAVKQSLRNILATNHGEKPFDPYFGANLRPLLFETFDPVVELMIQSQVENAIVNYEPRVEVLSVDVIDLSHRNAIRITCEYRIKSPAGTIDEVEVVVERLR